MGTTELKALQLESTVMAIREHLMDYFKGTCIHRFVEKHNITMMNVSSPAREEYQYIRRQAEAEAARVMYLDSAPILTVKLNPDRIIFNTKVLNRSPELRDVHKEIEAFMQEFLPGVGREVNDGPVRQ